VPQPAQAVPSNRWQTLCHQSPSGVHRTVCKFIAKFAVALPWSETTNVNRKQLAQPNACRDVPVLELHSISKCLLITCGDSLDTRRQLHERVVLPALHVQQTHLQPAQAPPCCAFESRRRLVTPLLVHGTWQPPSTLVADMLGPPTLPRPTAVPTVHIQQGTQLSITEHRLCTSNCEL
jgi:hypothetical protein